MELKSALSIAHGLSHTQLLEAVDVSGNPIGKFGMRLLLQSMNNNVHTKFTINLKDISADKEIKIEKNAQNSAINFDPQNPEGRYALDLTESFNQICLQHLLQAAEKAVARHAGAFDLKQCFHGA